MPGLSEILRHHRRRAADDPRFLDDLIESAKATPVPRDFEGAVRRSGLSLIAEVKRRSPSRGDLAPDLDPWRLGAAYAAGGAACLSVLTDEAFFAGSAADLAAARESSELPVLRKDFSVSLLDVCDTRLMGADAVLLIVAALDDDELRDMVALAEDLGLAALVEVHDEAESQRAVAAGARIIGVNQRNLGDFSVDHRHAESMARALPAGVVKVAESGIRGAEDAQRAAAAGYDAILVGEMLVTSADPEEAARELVRCS